MTSEKIRNNIVASESGETAAAKIRLTRKPRK